MSEGKDTDKRQLHLKDISSDWCIKFANTKKIGMEIGPLPVHF